MLTTADVSATAAAIAIFQEDDGGIPWPDGHIDPWNHVEACMGLALAGRLHEAARGYRWLAERQRPDGAWHATYRGGVAVDPALDSNFTAYVATGAWLHVLATDDADTVAMLWPCVDRAMDWICERQTGDGAIAWAEDSRSGRREPLGLLAGSSSIHMSLACALELAGYFEVRRPRWQETRERLGEAIRNRPHAFERKDRWAMDWYYPVLGGAIRGDAGRERLRRDWSRFVIEERGVLCTDDRRWVTAAETAELVMALCSVGGVEPARRLFDWVQHLRVDDGAYWMGANHDDGAVFPRGELPTWAAGAIVLAADALAGGAVATVLDLAG